MDEHSKENEIKANPSQRKPRTLGQIALEVFSIVLGVLLALGVSEWQEKRNNTERAGVAVANVRAELESNLKLLEIIHPNNALVAERIASGEGDSEDESTFIPGVQIRSSAWQALGSTGLGNFVDYEILIELSQLYSIIDVYRTTSYSFISSNMNMAATATALDTTVDSERFSQNFLTYFRMMVQIEEVLIDAHKSAISKIGESLRT
jgi:hypothetical protein